MFQKEFLCSRKQKKQKAKSCKKMSVKYFKIKFNAVKIGKKDDWQFLQNGIQYTLKIARKRLLRRAFAVLKSCKKVAVILFSKGHLMQFNAMMQSRVGHI